MRIHIKKGIQVKRQSELSEMYEASRNLAKELGLEPYYMYRQKIWLEIWRT